MRFKAFAPALLGAVAAFSMISATPASAAETMLTASQMRALIGDTIPAQYFDGTDYVNATLSFYDYASFGAANGNVRYGMTASTFGTPAASSFTALVYKLNVNGNPISNNVQYLTAKVQPVIQLSGLYDLRFMAGYSADNKVNNTIITFSNSGNVDVTSQEGIRYYSDYDDIGTMSLHNAPISSYYTYGSYQNQTLTFLTSEQTWYGSIMRLRVTGSDPFAFQMKYDSSCGVTQRGGIGPNNASGSEEQMGIYFYISTMYLSDSYTDTGSGDYGDSSSGSGGDGGTTDLSGVTSRLDQIITILNQIAAAEGIDITTPDVGDTSNVNNLSSGMDSASQAAADNQLEINSVIDYEMSLDISDNEYSYPDELKGIFDNDGGNGDIIKTLFISMIVGCFSIALISYIIFGRAS